MASESKITPATVSNKDPTNLENSSTDTSYKDYTVIVFSLPDTSTDSSEQSVNMNSKPDRSMKNGSE